MCHNIVNIPHRQLLQYTTDGTIKNKKGQLTSKLLSTTRHPCSSGKASLQNGITTSPDICSESCHMQKQISSTSRPGSVDGSSPRAAGWTDSSFSRWTGRRQEGQYRMGDWSDVRVRTFDRSPLWRNKSGVNGVKGRCRK